MVRRGGIRTLKEASSGTFHRALRRPYAKVLRLPIPPRARGTKYRPTRASNNRAPPQPSPPITPVRFAPGRLRLLTRPLATGSAPLVKTTGTGLLAAEMAAKRLELIRDLVPNARYRRHDDNPTFPGGGLFRGVRRDGTTGHDRGDLTADQISRQRRQPVIVKFPPGPSCVSRNVAAHTRMVSVARIRLDFRKSARPFKGIICGDVSEFESYMPSHAVRSPAAKM
jgi:hypothetical protein